jgi:hypothetical protein
LIINLQKLPRVHCRHFMIVYIVIFFDRQKQKNKKISLVWKHPVSSSTSTTITCWTTSFQFHHSCCTFPQVSLHKKACAYQLCRQLNFKHKNRHNMPDNKLFLFPFLWGLKLTTSSLLIIIYLSFPHVRFTCK